LRCSSLPSALESSGIIHVIVSGRFIVKSTKYQQGAYPGQPIRGEPQVHDEDGDGGGKRQRTSRVASQK
jgi:hypothetical protein